MNIQSHSESFYISNMPSVINQEADKQVINTESFKDEHQDYTLSDNEPKEEDLNEKELATYKKVIQAFTKNRQTKIEQVQDLNQMKKLQDEDEADGWDPNYKEGIFYVRQMSLLQFVRDCCSTQDAREMV